MPDMTANVLIFPTGGKGFDSSQQGGPTKAARNSPMLRQVMLLKRCMNTGWKGWHIPDNRRPEEEMVVVANSPKVKLQARNDRGQETPRFSKKIIWRCGSWNIS
jgi:hypothetical protein